MKVFRPLLLSVTAPSTCRNGQCKHQTRPCTTVLWVTQWERAVGGAEHKLKESRRLKSGRGIFSPWSEFSLHLVFQENQSSSGLILETQEVGNCSTGIIGWMSVLRKIQAPIPRSTPVQPERFLSSLDWLLKSTPTHSSDFNLNITSSEMSFQILQTQSVYYISIILYFSVIALINVIKSFIMRLIVESKFS